MPAAGASKPWAVQRGLRAGPLRRHETRLRKELVTDALAYGGVPELPVSASSGTRTPSPSFAEPVPPAVAREYKDIDLVTLKGKGKDVVALLRELGYAPQERFNVINGHERLLFHDLANGRQLDVFVGAFRMCHEIPVTQRIALDPIAVPLAELLLTKLQVVQLNEKDRRDIVALYDHDIADSDGDTVNGAEVGRACAPTTGASGVRLAARSSAYARASATTTCPPAAASACSTGSTGSRQPSSAHRSHAPGACAIASATASSGTPTPRKSAAETMPR